MWTCHSCLWYLLSVAWGKLRHFITIIIISG